MPTGTVPDDTVTRQTDQPTVVPAPTPVPPVRVPDGHSNDLSAIRLLWLLGLLAGVVVLVTVLTALAWFFLRTG
jgi:hypothetical protein